MMTIVVGMGSGRSGTQSLSRLVSNQPESVCFHEINPACMRWEGAWRTVLSMVQEFQAILEGGPREVTIDYTSPGRDAQLERLRSKPTLKVMGDVAFYYLPYARRLARLDVDIRMPCLRRDRDATIASYVRHLTGSRPHRLGRLRGWLGRVLDRSTEFPSRNHFVEHDGSLWTLDPKWDKCYPSFEAGTLEEALGLYWDYYYETASHLEARFPASFKVFDLDSLNSPDGQRSILDFLGYGDEAVLKTFHTNVGINS